MNQFSRRCHKHAILSVIFLFNSEIIYLQVSKKKADVSDSPSDSDSDFDEDEDPDKIEVPGMTSHNCFFLNSRFVMIMFCFVVCFMLNNL